MVILWVKLVMEGPQIGTFKTVDLITNLRFRMQVRKLSESVLSENESNTNNTIILDQELRWQEKIDQTGNSLFTVVDGEDNPFHPQLFNRTINNKTPFPNRNTIDKTCAIPKFNVVQYNGNPPGITPEEHKMYIAAILEDKTVILALLEHQDEILTVTPSFSATWYPITINGYCYEYKLTTPSVIPYQKSSKNVPVTSVQPARPKAFESLPLGTYRYVLNGIIESACGFANPNLFIRYLIELPAVWHSENTESLLGVTSQVVSTQIHGTETALLGQPFELDLTAKIEDPGVHNGSHQPLILFEVMAMDTWWYRAHAQGYGFAFLPLSPGTHTLEIPTWTPLADTLRTTLEEFFLGKGPQLSDLSYVGIPSTSEVVVMDLYCRGDMGQFGRRGTRISRFGFKVRPSGCITLRCHVLGQSSNFGQKSDDKRDSVLDQWSMAKISPTLHDVIEAFNKARENLHSVKSGAEIINMHKYFLG